MLLRRCILQIIIAQFALVSVLGLAHANIRSDDDNISFLTNLEGKMPILNLPGTKISVDVQNVESQLIELTNSLIAKDNRAKQFHWRIGIYRSHEPYAAAFLSSSTNMHLKKYNKIKDIYGVQDDKPIAFILVSTGMLRTAANLDELAFIFGHEISHHLAGDTKTTEVHIENYMGSQTTEILADRGGLDLIAGQFHLPSAYNQMLNLLPQLKNPDSVDKFYRYNQAMSAVVSSHHSTGVRLSLIQGYIEHLNQTDKNSNVTQPTAKPDAILKLTRNVRRDLREHILNNQKIKTALKKVINSNGSVLSAENQVAVENTISYELLRRYSNFAQSNSETAPLTSDVMIWLIEQLKVSDLNPDQRAQVLYLYLYSILTTKDGLQVAGSALDKMLMQLNPNQMRELEFLLNGLSTHESLTLKYFNRRDLLRSIDHTNQFYELLEKLALQNTAWERFITQKLTGEGLANDDLTSPDGARLPDSEIVWEFIFPYGDNYKRRLNSKIINRMTKNITSKSISDFKLWVHEQSFKNLYSRLQEFQSLDLRNTPIDQQSVIDATEHIRAAYLQTVKPESVKKYATIQNWELAERFLNSWHEQRSYKRNMHLTEQEFNDYTDTLLLIINRHNGKKVTLAYGDRRFLDYYLNRLVSNQNYSWHKRSQIIFAHAGTDILLNQSAEFRDNLRNELLSPKSQQIQHSRLTYLFSQANVIGIADLMEVLDTLNLYEAIYSSPNSSLYLDRLMTHVDPKTRFYTKHKSVIYAWCLSLSKNANIQTDPFYWQKLFYEKIDKSYRPEPSLQKQTDQFLTGAFKNKNGHDRLALLKQNWVRFSITPQFLTDQLNLALVDKLKNSTHDKQQIKAAWQEINTDFSLAENLTVQQKLRTNLAMQFQVQPNELDTILPVGSEFNPSKSLSHSFLVRGISGVVDFILTLPFEEQIASVDYFLGRTLILPAAFTALAELKNGQYLTYLGDARSELMQQPHVVKTLFVNSLLNGRNNEIMKPVHREKLIAILTRDISAKNKEVAKDFAEAVISSWADNATLPIAHFLSAESNAKNVTESEANMMEAFVALYGVPGHKLLQYLAFTGQFKEYEELFADAQDSLNTPDYVELLKYIQKVMGPSLKLDDIIIRKIQGAGSVNIAVLYTDRKSGEDRILNIPREAIQNKTEVDFTRFKAFLETFVKHNPSYEYLLGLNKLISESVKLEFQREAVHKKTNQASHFYSLQPQDPKWRIQATKSYQQENGVLLMQLAPGITGKNLRQTNPALYKETMGVLYKMEMNRIVKGRYVHSPSSTDLANPDYHDGQVLVDEKQKLITLIDFGQAVPISNRERDLVFDILKTMTGALSESAVQKRFAMWSKELGQHLKLKPHDLREVLTQTEPMDRFIRLVSILNLRGFEVPIASVHYVLSVNRLIKLGEKIGKKPNWHVATALIFHEIKSQFKKCADYLR